MRKALVVSSTDLEPLLGRSVLWRGDVQRTWASDPESALESARAQRPSLVVVEATSERDGASLIRRLRVDPAARSTAIVALRRPSVADEQPLREAGANLVLSDQMDPTLWDARLEELLNVPRRRDAQIPMRVRPWASDARDQEGIAGLALNISEHGVLLESTERLEVGAKVDLRFRLPGRKEQLEVVGQVVREEAVPRSGIKFVVLRGDAREQIRAFVESDRRSRETVAPRAAIDETAQWEEELRATEARKAAVLDAALDCIVTIDQEGRIIDFNSAAEQTFGYTRGDVVGRAMADLLIPPRLREEHRRGLVRHLETGKSRVLGRRVEMTAMRSDGSELPVELTVTPIQLRGRRLFTGYLRDISERKRAESIVATQHATTRVLAEAVTLREAAPRILQSIGEGFGLEQAALWIVEGEALRCAEVWRAPGPGTPPPMLVAGRSNLGRGAGFSGRVWDTGEPLWIESLGRDATALREGAALKAGMQAAVAVPIRLAGQVLGVMEFFAREPRPADLGLLQSLLAMGSQIAQFLERKRAEEAARAREERFRALVENSADAVALLAKDGGTLYVSPSGARVLGHSAEERQARSPFDLVHPEDAAQAGIQIQKCVESPGKVMSSELRARHKDGTWRWIEVEAVSRLDDPHVRAIVANYRDITERKTAEELLWESERRLREVITQAPIALWAVDHEGRFTLAEGKPLLAPGLRSRQLVGRSIFEVHAAQPRLLEHVRGGLRGEELSGVVEAQGTTLETHCAPLRDGGGEIVGVSVVATDVTARRRAEAAVAEQRDYLRRVLDISPSFIFAKDRQGRFTLVNQAVADAYGTSVEALLGKTDADYNANPDEVAHFRRDDLEVMDTQQEKLIPEEVITDARGRLRWLQTVKRPMVGPDGKAHQVLGFATDITARKHAETVQSALYRIARASSTATDMDALYAEIHAIVGELMVARNFYIALYDETARSLTFPYFVDERDAAPGPKPAGKGLTEYVLRTGRPLLASPETFESLVRMGEVELIGAPSVDWLGAPLRVQARTLGALVVQSYSEAVRYGPEELDVLAFVSQHIAEAIDRKRG